MFVYIVSDMLLEFIKLILFNFAYQESPDIL